MIKADKNTEAGVMPDESVADMGNYNEELVKAGIMPGRRKVSTQFEGRA
jgi:hypothetical protein